MGQLQISQPGSIILLYLWPSALTHTHLTVILNIEGEKENIHKPTEPRRKPSSPVHCAHQNPQCLALVNSWEGTNLLSLQGSLICWISALYPTWELPSDQPQSQLSCQAQGCGFDPFWVLIQEKFLFYQARALQITPHLEQLLGFCEGPEMLEMPWKCSGSCSLQTTIILPSNGLFK